MKLLQNSEDISMLLAVSLHFYVIIQHCVQVVTHYSLGFLKKLTITNV